jgi:hypothetical protein
VLLDHTEASKLIKFMPLDLNEAKALEDTDIHRKKTAELLALSLEGSCDTWKAMLYLQQMKKNTNGFDFRIHTNENGRPSAIVWITANMRNSWIRFGSTIFLDCMKRKMNDLHWPYIGPVVLDHEFRVQRICECLCVNETVEHYAFVMNSLFDMEPRRAKESIGLIYSDCFLGGDLLPLLGLQRPNNNMAWDAFHLTNDIWPKHFGRHLYPLLKADLQKLVYSVTRDDYDGAYGNIAKILQDDPVHLKYIKEFYDHPERYSRCYIQTIPGNLGKCSSQPAEANHASVVAHLGKGSNQDICRQLYLLFRRQDETYQLQKQRDSRYKKKCVVDASNDASSMSAKMFLSKYFYDNYWQKEILSTNYLNYRHTKHEDESYSIEFINDKDGHIEMTKIEAGARCQCKQHLKFGGMCRHEFSVHGKFVSSLFPDRMLQTHKMTRLPAILTSDNDHAEVDFCAPDHYVDDYVPDDAESPDLTTFALDAVTGDTTITDGVNLPDLNIPFDVQKKRESIAMTVDEGNPSLLARKRTRFEGFPRSDVKAQCDILFELIMASKEPMHSSLYASVKELQEIARLKPNDFNQEINEVLESQRHANALPLAGIEAGKLGRTRTNRLKSAAMEASTNLRKRSYIPVKNIPQKPTCSFCQLPTCKNISSCQKLSAIGTRIASDDVGSFRRVQLCFDKAIVDKEKISRIVTENRPILKSLPDATRWLAIHEIYLLRPDAISQQSQIREGDCGIEVSCYCRKGDVVERLAAGTADFDHRMAQYDAVMKWIYHNCATKAKAKNTRLIKSRSFIEKL